MDAKGRKVRSQLGRQRLPACSVAGPGLHRADARCDGDKGRHFLYLGRELRPERLGHGTARRRSMVGQVVDRFIALSTRKEMSVDSTARNLFGPVVLVFALLDCGTLMAQTAHKPAPRPAQKSVITNDDVIRMVRNKLPESVIIAAIQSKPSKFST